MYLGGGMMAWTTVFTVAVGRFILLSHSANFRPSRECRRLWMRKNNCSRSVSTEDWTARRVCWLMVSGFGKFITCPSGQTIVMSSDRNCHVLVCSRMVFRMVVVFPVSVWAVMNSARSPSAMHAPCISA